MSAPSFLQDHLSQERELFLKIVGAVPDSGLEYRPAERSRSARELVQHLLAHSMDLVELLDDGVIHHRNQVPIDSIHEAESRLDETYRTVIEKLGSVSDEDWGSVADFRFGDQLIMAAPRRDLAWLLFKDSIHHRGQLSTYLRPMGARVPSLYGPSADEEPAGH